MRSEVGEAQDEGQSASEISRRFLIRCYVWLLCYSDTLPNLGNAAPYSCLCLNEH